MKTRELAERICHENDGLPDDPRYQDEPRSAAPQAPPAAAPAAAPASVRPQFPEGHEWTVGSLGRNKIEDIWSPSDMVKSVLCIVELPGDRYGGPEGTGLRPKRVGIVGSQGSYGNPGDKVRLKVDNMGGSRGYRFLPDRYNYGKLLMTIPLSQANPAALRSYGVRSLFHFD